ncbi:MAG: hypothetical protein JKY98_09950 [Gammaproteobacteria bacterium]|nr:hypothetical protein [Gammaproteobacteria bacterium]
MSEAQKKEEYLSKRVLKRAASKGFREASEKAMEVAGSVVTIKDGWLVREHRNGTVDKIEKLPTARKTKIKALASK